MKPLFMWAGGKNKMFKHYQSFLPEKYNTYVEPFFGGGFMLTRIPDAVPAYINDSNSEIIGIYRSIKEDPTAFLVEVEKYIRDYFASPDRKTFYYRLRQTYWEEQSSALLLVLMRLSFNGVWQTCKASKGMFGTPAGLLNHKTPESIVDFANVLLWHERLQSVEITSGDFSHVTVPQNSFVFLDPPYRDSFTDYGTGFSDVDLDRLVEWSKLQAEHSTVWLANRVIAGDNYFEDVCPEASLHYFDVTYTAGRRKRTGDSFEAKKAQEILCRMGRDV